MENVVIAVPLLKDCRRCYNRSSRECVHESFKKYCKRLVRRSSKAPRPQQPYPVQFYPGQPYPGQPYAAMPPYPGQFYPGQPYPGQPYAAMPPYPAQGYPEQRPYAQQQPLQRDSVDHARPEQSGPQSESASARNSGDVRDAPLDRSYHPPLQAGQAWSQPGSPGQPDVQQSEPENPYSN